MKDDRMTDISVAAEGARVVAETEASREIAATAAPDNPNPDDGGQRSEIGGQTTDPTSDIRHPTSDPRDPRVEEPGGVPGGKPLERVTSFDRGRADIAARFKEKRAAQGGQVEFHGDMRDPSQTYGPYAGQMSDAGGQTPTSAGAGLEEPAAAQQQQATNEGPTAESASSTSDLRHPTSEPQSRLLKVKVHGREAFLPEQDVIAEAQKSLAAGNLLETAKEVLAGARGQMSDVRGQMSEGVDPTSDLRHPTSDAYTELAQTLQLDGAEVAGSKLRAAIESETAKARQEAAREAARQVRIETELSVSQRAMTAFETAHPELASDEFARDSITTQVQREINADLQAAVTQGILKELPRSQDERNGLHTQLRAFGAPVRPIGDIFTAASSKYATWRGETPGSKSPGAAPRPAPQPQPTTQPSPSATAPRVELTTARQERRAAIPTQPTNGTVPPRAPALPPEQTMAQRRSAAVMAMRKARGQIVA
jgi:hypothetical protein